MLDRAVGAGPRRGLTGSLPLFAQNETVSNCVVGMGADYGLDTGCSKTEVQAAVWASAVMAGVGALLVPLLTSHLHVAILLAPTSCPCSHFSIFLSPLLAWCYPFHGLGNHVSDPCRPQRVIFLVSVPLLLALFHSGHHSQPLCLLLGYLGLQLVCNMFNCSVQLH